MIKLFLMQIIWFLLLVGFFCIEIQMFVKSVFIFLVGCFGLVFIFNKRHFNQNIFINFSLLIVNLFLILQFIFCWNFNVYPYLYIVSFFILYKLICLLFPFKIINNQSVFFCYSFLGIISLEILIILFFNDIKLFQFYLNGSIFSIIIAAQLLLIIPYLDSKEYSTNKNWNKIFKVTFILFCYAILFITKGRAGILGFTFGIFVYNFKYLKSKISLIKALIIILCLMFALFKFKSDSSSGRLLIYKVLITELKPRELILGIGYGKFRIKYNHLQSHYFSTRSINSNDALFADNGYFLYNDLFQLIIETGLLGLIIIVFGIFKFVILFRTRYLNFHKNKFEFGAYLSCIVLLVSSLFSYPFQIFPIVIHFLFCITILLYYNKNTKDKTIQEPNNKLSNIIFILSSLCLIYYSIGTFIFYIKSNQAIIYSKRGFRQKTLKLYQNLSYGYIKDARMLYNYALELEKVKKIDKVISTLNESSAYLYNDQIEIVRARLLVQKHLYYEAEKHFKKAIFINPKLFKNRELLFNFYYDTKQYTKALECGNLILKLKVKVPSKSVARIRKSIFIKTTVIKKGSLN